MYKTGVKNFLSHTIYTYHWLCYSFLFYHKSKRKQTIHKQEELYQILKYIISKYFTKKKKKWVKKISIIFFIQFTLLIFYNAAMLWFYKASFRYVYCTLYRTVYTHHRKWKEFWKSYYFFVYSTKTIFFHLFSVIWSQNERKFSYKNYII